MDPDVRTSTYRSARLIFVPILIGLAVAQSIATCFVYLSNTRTYTAAETVREAGLLPIPTGPAIATLESFGATFWGGLFFTLSIGVGWTLLTWAAIRLWDLQFKRHRSVLAVYGAIWLGLLVFANIRGAALFPTLFCLLVPLATAGTVLWMGRSAPATKSALWILPVGALLLLTALWSTQLNQQLFTTIRDHVLLSNPVGRSVNDFYYRYTLYAAEAFKSFEQKTVRTGRLEGAADNRLDRRLRTLLARHDVLILEKSRHTDISILVSDDSIVLTSPSGQKVEAPLKQFMSEPRTWLRNYSEATDRLAAFRKMALVGLLLGFPILLYTCVYGLIRTVTGLLTSEHRTTWIASGLCLAIGILLFLPMLGARPMEMGNNKVSQALASDQWTHRVAALRYIETNQLEIARYPSYTGLLSNAMVVERYWLARALARSRTPATYSQLIHLLKDPHPNVICQTFFALGERGQRTAIEPIRRKLTRTDHWYAQWYGYRALRRLGWYQLPSR